MLRTTKWAISILMTIAIITPMVHADPPRIAPQIAATESYFSPQLKADFVLQPMAIPGFVFDGARIVGMRANSPLWNLGLRNGDVITRLDGMPVNNGKFWVRGVVDGYWALPQMEKHFGMTEVRFIRSGTTDVLNGYVDLGPLMIMPPMPPVPPIGLPPVPPE